MASVGLKKGTENVTANVPEDTARGIDRLAELSGLSRSRYVGLLLADAIERQRVFTVEVRTVVREDSAPYRIKTTK